MRFLRLGISREQMENILHECEKFKVVLGDDKPQQDRLFALFRNRGRNMDPS